MDIFKGQSIAENVSSSKGFFHITKSAIVTFILLFAYTVYKSLRLTCIRFYLIPPTMFRDTIKKGVNSSTGKISTKEIGIKKSSFRRRLLLATNSPLSYSTLPLNTNDDTDNSQSKYFNLKVIPNDRKNKESKDSFLMNIKPINVDDANRKRIFGFFHPHAYANGGGERVLWEAVMGTLTENDKNICVIYTFAVDNKMSVGSLLKNVNKSFGINFDNNLNKRICIIHLNDKLKWMLDPKSWKFATLIGQAIGSCWIMFTAWNQLVPDVWIDTQGWPFLYFWIWACLDLPIVSYVHYPLVSSDMLMTVKGIKWIYWWIMSKLYQFNEMFVNITLCNSTWTKENLLKIWNSLDESALNVKILYPPCTLPRQDNIESVNDLPIDKVITLRDPIMVYLAQFRPEKRHGLLLNHFAKYVKSTNVKPYKLVLIGSTRTQQDSLYVDTLKKRVNELNLNNYVSFELNAPTALVEEYLNRAEIGLNCMWKEHFGISVVEYELHAMLPICHASAGPLADIVVPYDVKLNKVKDTTNIVTVSNEEKSGFFFKDESDPDFKSTAIVQTYPQLHEVLLQVTALSPDEKKRIRTNALLVAREKFGNDIFCKEWQHVLREIWSVETSRRELRGKVEALY